MSDDKDHGPTTSERMRYYAAEAPKLAERACRQAIVNSGVSPSSITHLITVTCTGFHSPGVDIALIKRLGLRATVQRMQIGFMGCHGAINGLRGAHAITSADPDAIVLLCAVELCSLHFRYGWDPEKAKANALFADGAAAVVGTGHRRGNPHWSVATTGSCLLPDSEEDMEWRIGDHGFEKVLSARIPELIGAYIRPWLAEWLTPHGVTIESVGSWAIHPGGPRILTAAGEALALSKELLAPSRAVLAEHGNMSSPTVLFILERLRQSRVSLPCVVLAFGPGLVAEAALIVE